ncbi:MAG: PspA/IM30 family protein [Planctomycetes bacterium]|nr:PspA/IM30 family protein [Planctomycetota bacterium]
MGLFQRIGDIISANLNEMTEGLEEPEMMLKQAIREMEQSIAEATRETAKVLANEKLMAKELSTNEQQALDWRRKAETAVDDGDDGLARRALRRKQEHEKLVTALRDQLTTAQDASRTLKCQLDGMQAKMAEAKRNLATLSARKRAADFKKRINSAPSTLDASGANDAFAKFERMREKVERAEAEADALAELRGKTALAETELDGSGDSSDDLDAALEALKRRQGK